MRTSRRFSWASRATRKEGTVDLACLRRASAWATSRSSATPTRRRTATNSRRCVSVYELLRNRKPRLILPHLKVGVRRLGGDRDSSSNLVGLRSLEFVSGRSFAAAQSPGKIDFPTRRSADCILTLIAAVTGKTICYRAKWTRNALVQ